MAKILTKVWLTITVIACIGFAISLFMFADCLVNDCYEWVYDCAYTIHIISVCTGMLQGAIGMTVWAIKNI